MYVSSAKIGLRNWIDRRSGSLLRFRILFGPTVASLICRGANADGSNKPVNMQKRMTLRLSYKGRHLEYQVSEGESIGAVKEVVQEETGIPVGNQKWLTKPAIVDDEEPALKFVDQKIMLVGTPASVAQEVEAQKSRILRRSRPLARAKLATRRIPTSQYTFSRITVLPHLAQKEKALALLQRLAQDPGITHVMDKYQLAVGELTEMEPLGATSHDSKILGLNQNAGAKILLRLRTDDYDGFRDYKTVRRTLCHELSHNRHGEHDSQFWAFYRVLDKEVVRYSGGNVLGTDYAPPSQEDEGQIDDGVFRGGSFVLGGSNNAVGREAILRAAEARRDKNNA
jgi:hypothetical protein